MPEKVEEMKRLWLIEAVKYSALPLDDRAAERFNAQIAGRPELITGNTQVLYEGMTGLTENTVLNLKNKSFAITAELVIPEGGAKGVVMSQGGTHAGWSIYLLDGVPHYTHNFVGLQRYTVSADKAVPAGTHQVRLEFDYDGGGINKGGTATLFIDGEEAGQGRIEHTVGIIFASDETVNVGLDAGTAVSEDYDPQDNAFSGGINWVQLDVGEAAVDLDHHISPEERMNVILSRQ
jgi:arylsulfatase